MYLGGPGLATFLEDSVQERTNTHVHVGYNFAYTHTFRYVNRLCIHNIYIYIYIYVCMYVCMYVTVFCEIGDFAKFPVILQINHIYGKFEKLP